MNARWLSMHVPYVCRHAGACCSSGWDIPVERTRVEAIATLQGDRRWLRVVPHAPDDIAGALALTPDGQCVFHQTHGSQLGCAIQNAVGHDAIPSACQHFPRECLIDRRGVSVTLSHYCPTAAGLLFTHAGAVEITAGPPPVPSGLVEGFDARDALPPLLTAGMLMDDESYAAWEAHMIRRLAGSEAAQCSTLPEQRLTALRRDAETLSAWRPGGVTLLHAVERLALTPGAGSDLSDPDWTAELHLYSRTRASVPAPYQWPEPVSDAPALWRDHARTAWHNWSDVVGRYLAAHAFASWMAYQGSGLASMVDRVHLALAVLRLEVLRQCAWRAQPLDRESLLEGIRQSDLLIVHLADRERLARLITASRTPR